MTNIGKAESEPETQGSQAAANDSDTRTFANESEKDRLDIYAQEGMWRSANFLVVLTFIQVLVGAVTIYYLVRTLRTQQGELGEAQKVTKSQRAYLWKTNNVMIRGLKTGKIELGVGIRNYGSTPAKYVSVWTGYSLVGVTDSAPQFADVTDEIIVGNEFMPPSDEVIYWTTVFEKGAEHRFLNQLADIVFVARITYLDIYDDVNEFGDIAVRVRNAGGAADPGKVNLATLSCSTRPTLKGRYQKHEGSKY